MSVLSSFIKPKGKNVIHYLGRSRKNPNNREFELGRWGLAGNRRAASHTAGPVTRDVGSGVSKTNLAFRDPAEGLMGLSM